MDRDTRSSWLAQRLANARGDAARIAKELEQRGHLSTEQAAALEGAVETAVARGGDLLEEALREPRRLIAALRRSGGTTAPPSEVGKSELEARVGELEARVALLEGLIARGAGGRKDTEPKA